MVSMRTRKLMTEGVVVGVSETMTKLTVALPPPPPPPPLFEFRPLQAASVSASASAETAKRQFFRFIGSP